MMIYMIMDATFVGGTGRSCAVLGNDNFWRELLSPINVDWSWGQPQQMKFNIS